MEWWPVIVYPRNLSRYCCCLIVNTDPHDKPGEHWLDIWTKDNVCKLMVSFTVSLVKQWKYVVTNMRSLQAVNSRCCGHYVLMYFNARAKGQTFQQFLNFGNVQN